MSEIYLIFNFSNAPTFLQDYGSACKEILLLVTVEVMLGLLNLSAGARRPGLNAVG